MGDVDVVLYHKDTHKSNGNIAVIKSTWDNDERSIVKSSFYEEMEKITFSFDAPKITNIYVDHENYTMTIEYDAWPGTHDEPKGVTAKRITEKQIVLELDEAQNEKVEIEKSMEIRWRTTDQQIWNNIGTVNRWEKRSKTVTVTSERP